jgi:hypothetical protein
MFSSSLPVAMSCTSQTAFAQTDLLRVPHAALTAFIALILSAVPAAAAGDSLIMPVTNVLQMDNPPLASQPTSRRRCDKQCHTSEAQRQAKQRSKSTRPPEDKQSDGVAKDLVAEPPPAPEEQEVKPKTQPYPVVDPGYCLPSGQYRWLTQAGPREGVVPNPTYSQQPGIAPGKFEDSGYPAVCDQLIKLIGKDARGTPISNAEFATLVAAQAQQVSELVNDPERRIYQAQAEQAAKQADASNNAAECAEGSGDTAFENITEYLLNVANEEAGTPTTSRAPFKVQSQAVWMVQQMYKQCYIPMAILFLLPGAVITQAKSLVSYNMLGTRDDDTTTPFAGIMRATIAVFLIPATQLVMSYVIDVGNSVTYCVSEELKKHGGIETVLKWAHEQTYNNAEPQYQNYQPNFKPVEGQPEIGKISGKTESKMRWEDQTHLSSTMQSWFNTLNNVLAQGLLIINAFQLVMMCYLLLLGPIAASFFAWPSGVGRDLFRKTFAGWLDGVVILALWKFWWNICLLCMALRLASGYVQNPTDQYELFMYTAFMAILTFVPFNPFEFRPGEIVSHVLEKAQQHAGRAGQTGAGSGGGPAGGAGNASGPAGAGGPVGARHSRQH